MNLYPISAALLCLSIFTEFSSRSNDNQASFTAGDVSINCGSTGASTGSNGRLWIGDVRPKASSFLQLRGSSAASSAIRQSASAANPHPHKTARISGSQFSYAFQLNSTGQKIIRLHFNPTPYKGFKGLRDFFTVEAGRFTLLGNFSASLTASALGVSTIVKEFCLNIQENQQLTLTFSPESSPSRDAYVFINGIEIISTPSSLSYFDGGDVKLRAVGEKSLVYVDDSTALEIVHRVHIKEDPALSAHDSDGVFRKWGTERADKVRNNTWKMPVVVGFRYLIRLHFSAVGLKIAEVGGSNFKILINEMVALTNTEMVRRDDNNIALHKDYMVEVRGRKRSGRGDILVSLESYNEFPDGIGVLEGFEIVKLSNPDDSLANPNPLPPPQKLQFQTTIRNLLSVLGYTHAIATVAMAVISVLSIVLHKLREICEAGSTGVDEPKPSAEVEKRCRRFSLAEIQLATRNFSSGLVIGRGGFGKVYKGLVDNEHRTVAIKRLQWNSGQGAREFLTEIETLSELRHVNLVSLIGYCSENSEMILVYEYMACGTLADHLYKLGRDNHSYSPLNWKQRLNICIGAARGLDYLHTGNGVIHRDVKASNILLDANFIAKVSDFGLAKTEDRSKLQTHVSTLVKGTRGYFDPYYIRSGKLTRKSDIYAFGVVLLEVLCGRRALDLEASEEERLLSSWAVDKIRKGEVDQIVASNLREEIWPNSLKTFVEVAERCLLDEPKNRPTMSQIVLQLESALEQQDSIEKTVVLEEDIISSQNGEQPESAESFIEIFNRVRLEIGSPASTPLMLQQVPIPADKGEKKKQKPYTFSPSDEADRKKQKAYSPSRFWAWGWNRMKPSKSKEITSLLSEIRGSCINLPKFDLTSITTVTNQFSPSQKIGDSERRSVYKAVLPSGKTVAVIRYYLTPHALKGFKNEIFLGSSLNHRNVMNLLGYCIHENGEAILVYDYMEQGSLYDHLHKSGYYPLTWKQRLQICIDSAKGLDYLHTGSDSIIIHHNVKPSKILLNEKWIAKLSNLSDSKAWPSIERDVKISTSVICTLGYVDPEFFLTSQFTEKSDIYSYGVVLFEVLCGRSAIDNSSEAEQRNLANWATICFKEGKLEEIIDSNLIGQITPGCFSTFAETAAACLNFQGIDRPVMRDVVQNLELAMQLHEPVASNVTLHNHLYNTRNPPLTWKQRLQLCLGAAKGLDCLHTGTEHVIIHHDVRTTNILLDEKWVAKVYDSTLSQVLRSDSDQTNVSTAVRGTTSNLDPKYYTSMHLAIKSDIYSFGVLLLEVLSARKQEDLIVWGISSFKEGKLDEIIDSNLKNQIEPECLNKFVETVIACLSLRGTDQPMVRDVIRSLELAMQLQEAKANDEDIRLLEFDPSMIAAATNQFSSSHKIGEGGFASIYKAVLPTGFAVAVKIFSSLGTGFVDHIRNEILSVSSLYHQNITKLLGYCIREQGGMLIYEFMENGTLDKLISDELRRHQFQWSERFRVMIGIAEGVIYLHRATSPRMTHRDLNLASILLDNEMKPKISVFGLDKNIEDDQAEMSTFSTQNFSYTTPEYISEKKDVYGFGVLVLEILSGKRSNGDQENLIDNAWKQWNKGARNAFDLVDESLGGAFSEEEALRCIQVGLLCSYRELQQRPTMASALQMLLGEDSSLQEKMAQSQAEFLPNVEPGVSLQF